MSVVVAYREDEGNYAMAGDTLWSHDNRSAPCVYGPKVFVLGPDRRWLLGLSGARPAVEALRAVIEKDLYVDEGEYAAWGAFRSALQVRNHLAAAWRNVVASTSIHSPVGPGEYPRTGALVLVVGPAGIFELDSCLDITDHTQRGYAAIGSGDSVALGSMWATTEVHPGATPGQHVSVAVRAACHFISTCRDPDEEHRVVMGRYIDRG